MTRRRGYLEIRWLAALAAWLALAAAAVVGVSAHRGRPAAGRPGVLLVTGRDPIYAVGRDTFLDELLTVAGGRNVAADAGFVRYDAALNDEQVTRLAPEVIIEVAADLERPGPEELARRQRAWRNLDVPAVRAGRVVVLADPSITIPGAHVGRTAMLFARAIHPEAFAAGRPATGQDE